MLLFLEWFCGHRPAPLLDHPEFGRRLESLAQYDLGRADLERYRAILVSTYHDQRHLAREQARLTAYLDRGGTIVFNGHVVYPFLPWLASFRPSGTGRLPDLIVRRAADHPVFDGVSGEDLTYRRGVAGFYGRGGSDPPPGAQVLNIVGEDARPVDWLWHRPAGGRVLIHSGNDMWMYANDDSSAARIAPQLLRWLLE